MLKIVKYLVLIFVSYTLLVTVLGYYIFGRAATSTPYQSEPRGRLEAFSDTSKRPNGPAVMTFYALGDWGTADQIQKQVALLLKKNIANVPDRIIKPFVLAAGDNVYQNGLARGWDNPEMKVQLTHVIDANYADVHYQNAPIEYHVVAGNHDHSGDLRLWETYVESRFAGQDGSPIIFSYNQHHPDIPNTNDQKEYEALNEATGLIELPEAISIDSGIATFIAIDSQKMLALYARVIDEPELQLDLDAHWAQLDLLAAAGKSWTFILAHHPLSTYGPHGGSQDSIPQRLLSALLFFSNHYDDLDHPAYQSFIADFEAFSRRHPIIFIAGHDHSLQLNEVSDSLLQVVSGSAGKTTSVNPGKETIYSYASPGFARFDITPSEVWIEFMDLDENLPVLYRLKQSE
ncbi:metallophosphoesterase [Pseudomonadales bacterium]|nr:metallophosphoesterase [Pseudomonadales bacterium]